MPTLDWIGKKIVLNHHRTVPCRLLQGDRELSTGEILQRKGILFRQIPYEIKVS